MANNFLSFVFHCKTKIVVTALDLNGQSSIITILMFKFEHLSQVENQEVKILFLKTALLDVDTYKVELATCTLCPTLKSYCCGFVDQSIYFLQPIWKDRQQLQRVNKNVQTLFTQLSHYIINYFLFIFFDVDDEDG